MEEHTEKEASNCTEEMLHANTIHLTVESNTMREENLECDHLEGNNPLPVCAFFLAGKCRFNDKCKNAHPPEVTAAQVSKCKGSQKKLKQKNQEVEENYPQKQPSMKTAGDVIKRLQWDELLPPEYFTIGYLDRFVGIVEKPFTAFSWEDLASVDLDTLAIPQHRIQYFKYKGEKVWDKNERIDRVFGSIGEMKETIHEVMDNVDKRLREAAAEKDLDDSDEFHSCSDDDDDESVKLEFSPMCTKPSLKAPIPEEDRSTHFIAIQIISPDIKENALKVQDSIKDKESALFECCMKPQLLHVTLTMLHLKGLNGIDLVRRCLTDMKPEIEKLLSESDNNDLVMHGLDTFGQRVLYAHVIPPPTFWPLVNMIVNKLGKLGSAVKLTNSFDFVPHMTLVKVSRPASRARRSKFIDPSYYMHYADLDFGSQQLNNLHLCILDSTTRADGFYNTVCNFSF